MTNFEPIKKNIWDAVKSDKNDTFNKECQNLMNKAVGDWWRIGWNVYPQNVNELIDIINNIAKSAHESWIKAIECGDAPNEDVSPGEGFAMCSKLIKDLQKERDDYKKKYEELNAK